MQDPFNSYKNGDPDLLGRNHKTLPKWSDFGPRLAFTLGALILLFILLGVVVALL
jgi:hypothetical protein